MRKKILITTFTFPPQANGVSHAAAAHAAGLARLGHDVTVATAADPRRKGDEVPGVRVEQFDVSGCGKLFLGGGYHGDVEGYQRFVASFDGDVIMCQCWQTWSTDLAVAAFGKCRAAKILVSHGVSANILLPSVGSMLNWFSWRPYVWRMGTMLEAFDHVVLLGSTANKKAFYDHYLMNRMGLKNFSVIPNGAGNGKFSDRQTRGAAFGQRFGLGDRRVVLCVANYDKMKGQGMALRAFLGARLPNAALVFIGGEINEYARRVALSCGGIAGHPDVLFLEKLDQETIVSAYCAADIFLCPSRLEVQPLVIIDAIAAGVPWICTDVGCVCELPGGVVVRSGGEMASQLTRLLNDDEARRRLAQAGLAASESTYNWDAVVRSYDALVERLCG
jgi:glycosyltransferase involved in cell wall biosynthesis